MLYVAQSHPPSAQVGALSLPFFPSEQSQQTLVINKLSRLEFHDVKPDGALSLREEVQLHGGVAAMEGVKLPNHPTSSLLVLTTSLQLFCLSYSSTTSSITTLSSTSLSEPFARLSEFQSILVSPCGRAAVVYAYDGLVRVIPLRAPGGGAAPAAGGGKKRRASTSAGLTTAVGEDGTLDLSRSYNVRLQALNVLSLAFITSAEGEETGSAGPALAVLSTAPGGGKTLSSYILNLATKELDESTAALQETQLTDAGSENLVAVEGGVLVVGEESVTFFSVSPPKTADDGEGSPGKGKGKAVEKAGEKDGKSGKRVTAKMPVSRITAHALLSPSHLLLGDLYGKLLLVTLSLFSPSPSISIQDLGDATSATSIVSLARGLVYLSSRFGDSQVVRLPAGLVPAAEGEMEVEGETGGAGGLELVESFTGLAPIVDAVVLGGEGEDGGSGSSSLLLLSGAYKTGSLRLLRRGLGISELASLELEGIQRVWWLTRGDETLIVTGSFDGTRVLKLSVEGEAGDEEADIEELEDVEPFVGEGATGTLLAANVGDLLVNVTTQAALFASSSPGDGGKGSWKPEDGKKKILAAVARDGRLALAIEGGAVVILEAKDGQLAQVGTTTFDTDVSALALSSSFSGVPATLAVALWTPSQTVHLLSVPSLSPVAQHTLSTSFLIRSLALPTFASTSSSSPPLTTLFCGLGDGSLTTFSVSLKAGEIDAKSEKTVQLGRRPLLLTEFEQRAGETAVFVASERPTVVSMAKGGRLSYASVNFGDLSAVSAIPLKTATASSTLLTLASPTSLTLGRLSLSSGTSGGQVDVRTIPLDEDEPRRIAHDRKGRCFAVVCSRRDVDRKSGQQETTGRVRVIEEEDFSTRATFTLPPNEEGQSVCALRLPAHPEASSLFIVGSTKLDLSAPEPTEGRLLVLRSTTGSDTLEELTSRNVGGCPYGVVPLAGEGLGEYVAAAVNSQVAVFRLVTRDDASVELEVVATWSGAFVALSLAAGADGTLVVGDALRSITVLRFSLPSPSSAAASTKPKLEELGKDYRSRYMVGVESLPSPSSSSDGPAVERFIGAETDLNLFTVEREPAAGVRNLADAGTLTAGGAFHLGEMVTKFRRGAFGQLLGSSSSTASSGETLKITPQLVFTTSAGSVGVVVELDDESSKVLSGLERNMRAVEGVGKGVGGLEQEAFRSFKSSSQRLPSAGFIDGSFVELFLDLAPSEQDAVLAGKREHEAVGVGREEVIRVLEEVARAH